MIQVGDIVKGPLWPEVVEIKNCTMIQNQFYQVEAYGKNTSKYYQVIILPEQLTNIEIINTSNKKNIFFGRIARLFTLL